MELNDLHHSFWKEIRADPEPILDDVVLIPWNACTQTDRGCHYLLKVLSWLHLLPRAQALDPCLAFNATKEAHLWFFFNLSYNLRYNKAPGNAQWGFPIPIQLSLLLHTDATASATWMQLTPCGGCIRWFQDLYQRYIPCIPIQVLNHYNRLNSNHQCFRMMMTGTYVYAQMYIYDAAWVLIQPILLTVQTIQGLGRTWSTQFILQHSDTIQTYWSTTLHSNWAECVNDNTLNAGLTFRLIYNRVTSAMVNQYLLKTWQTLMRLGAINLSHSLCDWPCQPEVAIWGWVRHAREYHNHGYSHCGWTSLDCFVHWKWVLDKRSLLLSSQWQVGIDRRWDNWGFKWEII